MIFVIDEVALKLTIFEHCGIPLLIDTSQMNKEIYICH
jgi:hypothetical protein